LQWVIKYHVACLGEANFSLEFIHITNASRGTVNAWHFLYAEDFVVTLLCVKLVGALPAP